MSVEEKWQKLSQDDRLYVEQIINQLLELRGFAMSDDEYQNQMNRLSQMKEKPEVYSKDAFQVINDLQAKIRHGKS